MLHPSIIALWHGQFFLLPGIYPREIPGRAIVARHDDAEALSPRVSATSVSDSFAAPEPPGAPAIAAAPRQPTDWLPRSGKASASP